MKQLQLTVSVYITFHLVLYFKNIYIIEFLVFVVYLCLNYYVVEYWHLNSFFRLSDISTSLVVEDDPSTQAKFEVSQS